MKAGLKFKFPEEREAFELAVKARNWMLAIHDLDNFLRSQIKYNNNLSEIECSTFQRIRDELYVCLDNNDVSF